MGEPVTLDMTTAKPIQPVTLDMSTAKPIQSGPAEQPGFLDRDIPLSGPWYNPTLSGVQSIGRGVRNAVQGVGHMIAHPIDTVTETAKGIASLPSQVAQIPGAIHDINQSPDPLSHYAKAAQDTAGEGAGQALTALATEGIARGIPKVASAAKPIVRAGLRTASDIVDPDITGIASPRLAHMQRIAGRVADKMEPKPIYPGAHLPEAPPVYPGAPFPEKPAVNPGAPFPEKPPAEVLQARGVGTGAKSAPEPSAGLRKIPVRTDSPSQFPGAPFPEKPPAEVFQARGLERGGQAPQQPPSSALGKIAVVPEKAPRPITYPPEAPNVIERPKAVRPERSRFLEDKGTQEEIRDAADREDQSRLSQERREWFARNQPGFTKGELTEQAAKAVKAPIAKVTSAEPRGVAVATPETDDLTPILKKSLAAARKQKGASR